MKTKTSIVIVSYNQAKLLEPCIKSLLHFETLIDKEIVIVDNNSTDPEIRNIPQKYPQITITFLPSNIGFGRANNFAVRELVHGENILFLNPDTTLIEPIVDKMQDYLAHNPAVSVIGPKLLNPDKTIQSSTHGYPGLFKELFRLVPGVNHLKSNSFFIAIFSKIQKCFKTRVFERFESYSDEIKPVKEVTGACFLMKKDNFNKAGGFDPEYFMYLEDADFCFQVKKLGGQIVYFPQVCIIHELHGARNNMSDSQVCELHEQRYRSLFYFFRKNYGSAYLYISKIVLCCMVLFRIAGEFLPALFIKKMKLDLKKDLHLFRFSVFSR